MAHVYDKEGNKWELELKLSPSGVALRMDSSEVSEMWWVISVQPDGHVVMINGCNGDAFPVATDDDGCVEILTPDVPREEFGVVSGTSPAAAEEDDLSWLG